MRKNYLNIIFPALALLLCCQACDDSALSVDRHEIGFSASIESVGPETKALLESEDILTDGNKVKIYGFATKTTGAVDIPGHLPDAAGDTKLNDGQVITYDSGAGSWKYDSGEAYQWQAQADHRFFGWLTHDAKSNLDAPSGTTYASNVLTVPATTLGINVNNFDFAYSEVVTRTAASADYSTVELPLKHLYASFSLAARNYTKDPVFIKSVTIHGLKDAKGATVTFGADASSVTYGTGSTMSATNLISGGDVQLAKAGEAGDAKVNIVQGASDTQKYFLVWPQTETEMTPTTTYVADGWNPGTAEPYMEIVYSQGSATATQMTSKVPIPHDTGDDDDSLNGWPAGTRHNMELSFSDRLVKLGVYAGDWNEQDPVIDYEGAVSVTQTLRIASGYESNCVLSDDGKTAYFKAGYPIILQFRIDRPLNATWLVTRGGAFDVVEIDNFTDGDSSVIGDENDTYEGLVDSRISRIALIPRIKDLQKNEYRVTLSFSVRLNSGEVVNIDDLIFNDTAQTGTPVSPRTLVLLK